MFLLHKTKLTGQQVRWIAIFLSLIFSLLIIAQDEVVNKDGAIYLVVADLISQGEWQAAYTLYPWPFFPILISFASQVTGLIPEYIAYLLSMFFLTLVVVCFIDFIRLLGGDVRTQMLAGLVILCLPYFNESRDEILRDHGYWLLYLVGLRFLFQHYQAPSLKWGLAWNVAILMSCFFRMEGFVMMAMLPLVLLIKKELMLKQRFVAFAQANLITLLLLLAGLLLLPWIGDNLGRLTELVGRLVEFWGALTIGLEQKAEVIRQGVLPTSSEKFALQSVILILVLLLTLKILTVLTPIYGVMLFLPRLYSHLVLPQGFWLFIVWAIFVNLAVLIVFVVPAFFLQARFTMPLVLTTLLLVPFLLNEACSFWQQKKDEGLRPRLFPATMVVVMLMGADGLISFGGDSKQYLRDAAEWVQANAKAGNKIATTESLRFCYYINRDVPFDHSYICQHGVTPQRNMMHDYFLFYAKKGTEAPAAWVDALEQAHFAEVQRFENRGNDSIVIYQRSQQ